MNGKEFTELEVRYLRRFYSNGSTSIMAKRLKRPKSSLYNKAHILGIYKTKKYLLKHASFQKGTQLGKVTQFQKGHVPDNKGKTMSPEIREEVKHTFFKKGHKPKNTKTDGHISIRKDTRTGISYKYIRISEGIWELLQRYIWIQEHGEIPKGYNVVFKDGNSLNVTLENLELLSDSELLKKNYFYKYPKEIQRLIQIKGALTRQINKRNKDE